MAADWKGYKELRHRVVNRTPHFGNDDASVDSIAARIIEQFSALLKRRTPYRGGQYILGTTAGGENMHVEFGRITGATPDGRRSGETLADSIGPVQGRDRSGITAMLNSVAGLPHRLLPTATTLNVKLDPKLLGDEKGITGLRRSSGVTSTQAVSNCSSTSTPGRCYWMPSGTPKNTLTSWSGWPDTARRSFRSGNYLQDEVIARTDHMV